MLRGAKIVFVDIRRDTMNIDETLIEAAITDEARAIVPVHYAGVACEMDTIMAIADKYNLFVVEDAAQGVMSTYKGRALGTIGHIGCFSHETKNYTAGGEGGSDADQRSHAGGTRGDYSRKVLTAASSFAAWWINIPGGTLAPAI